LPGGKIEQIIEIKVPGMVNALTPMKIKGSMAIDENTGSVDIKYDRPSVIPSYVKLGFTFY
jgi:hypothetical protein